MGLFSDLRSSTGSPGPSPRTASLAGALAFAAAGFVAGSGTGCQTRCFNNFDCGPGSFCFDGRCETECFTDEDCREPPECAGNPTTCQPKGLKCSGLGRCVGRIIPTTGVVADNREDPLPNVIDGFDDEPGSGVAFVINNIALADNDLGFNVDGRCGDNGCIDNLLGDLGRLANNQIDQGIKAGDSLLLIELAGLENPYQGNERSMTVKLYGARDADDPVKPDNNFVRPPGETSCCTFKISPQSLRNVPAQARARSPALIDNGRLESLAPVEIQFTLTIGSPPHPEVRITQTRIRGIVPADLSRFSQGLLGGAVPVGTLAAIDNPYCRAGNSSQCPPQVPQDSKLIDLVSIALGSLPDIDNDLDGLECVVDDNADGLVDTCCDGVPGRERCPRGGCPSNQISAPGGAEPNQCARDPRMADGYSIALTFSGVAANIVGISE